MYKGLKRLFAATVMSTLLLSACGGGAKQTTTAAGNAQQAAPAGSGAASTEAAKPGASTKDTLVVASVQDCQDLDPQGAASQQTWRMKMQVYEPIVQMDGDNNLMPCLAESWEWEDDLTVVFHLRKGVKFHDGSELKASDVLFTYKRCKEMPTAQIATEMLDIDKCEAVDDYTVRLKLISPWPQIRTRNLLCGIITSSLYTPARISTRVMRSWL